MTGEVGDVRLKEADLVFTSDVEDIQMLIYTSFRCLRRLTVTKHQI